LGNPTQRAQIVRPLTTAVNRSRFAQYPILSSKEKDHMATSKRGFASMDPAKQREIASKGGRAAHAKGTAHEFTSDEARVAGRKGGEAVSRDRAHMSAIGREGGHSRGARARANTGSGSSENSARSGDQVFERQVNSERSGFEGNSDRGSRNNSGRSDSERGDQRPFAGRGEL
jgi:general stress protein YciG